MYNAKDFILVTCNKDSDVGSVDFMCHLDQVCKWMDRYGNYREKLVNDDNQSHTITNIQKLDMSTEKPKSKQLHNIDNVMKWVVINDEEPPMYVPIFVYDVEYENVHSLTIHQHITKRKIIETYTHWMLVKPPCI